MMSAPTPFTPTKHSVASHRFCVAPMMEYTDRHCRYLLRLLSKHSLLYTEMVTAPALARGKSAHRFLDFDETEHPIALQLGGSDPQELANAVQMAEAWGYDEINLNVGCPSNRVTSGRFGACLMAEPDLVAECVKAMSNVSARPITVKTRIGIDNLDEDRHLDLFIDTVAAAGCQTFVIHARKAWLQGLSPKENREIPPLNYDRVFRLKNSFPNLKIILNGGLQTLDAAQHALSHVRGLPIDGVMLGRSVYNTPFMLAEVDRLFFADQRAIPTRAEIVERYVSYAEGMIRLSVRPHHIFRHLSGLYHGCAGARSWRQTLSKVGQNGDTPRELISLAQTLDRDTTLAA